MFLLRLLTGFTSLYRPLLLCNQNFIGFFIFHLIHASIVTVVRYIISNIRFLSIQLSFKFSFHQKIRFFCTNYFGIQFKISTSIFYPTLPYRVQVVCYHSSLVSTTTFYFTTLHFAKKEITGLKDIWISCKNLCNLVIIVQTIDTSQV